MAAAVNRGSQLAVRCENGEVFTLSQIASAVHAFSHTLHDKGVRAGMRVVLSRLGNLQLFVGFLAVARLGATSIFADKMSPELTSILKPNFTVKHLDDGTSATPVILLPDRFSMAEAPSNFHPQGYTNGGIASCIIGSSGSTGKRKYLSLSAEQITLAITDQVSILPRPMRRTLLTVPPRTRYGLQMALTIIHQGGCVVWAESVDHELDLISRGEVDHIVGAPLVYSSYVKTLSGVPEGKLKLDFCIVGGSKISDVLAEKIRRSLSCDLYVQYGSTELGPVAIGPTEELARLPDYSGRLAPWINAWTINDQGERLPPGDMGRLVFEFHKPRVAATSLTGSAADGTTKNRHRAHVSDDYGTVVDENVLLIESRFQDRVNVGGNKTSLSVIKKKIADLTSRTVEMEVIAIKTEEGYDRIVVVAVGEPSKLTHFVQAIAKSRITKDRFQVLCVNRLPLNDFGKVDTERLRSVAQEQYAQFARDRNNV